MMYIFAANALGLPLLNPYLDKNATFSQGVNFAVAGSTALQTERLLENRILSPVTNSSIPVQYNWFLDHLNSICSSQTDCAKILGQALFMVGETGGNDFNYALLQGKTIQETQSLVPGVVDNIIDLARKLINLGAKRLVIPGNFPIGCFPIYLTAFKTNDTSAYDDKHCLKDLNAFALYQNQYLQRAIQQLRKEHPGVVIMYADYYTAFQSVFRRASQLGFDEASTQKACCGSGGDYNFSLQKMCGMPGVSACSNPDQHISWDGIHPTQATYQRMAEFLITGLSIFHCY
ncbi:GDSL esterase/lipase [Thalictrum thalictroides]|uniref:GDSL esterase/lipase n=2 Tax=Thalictrum thalictroides TaxID=46969 RepID=A0A7J6UTR3_THATH|nr:GDSL esterase/lipase [Thalictrum thalictroides]